VRPRGAAARPGVSALNARAQGVSARARSVLLARRHRLVVVLAPHCAAGSGAAAIRGPPGRPQHAAATVAEELPPPGRAPASSERASQPECPPPLRPQHPPGRAPSSLTPCRAHAPRPALPRPLVSHALQSSYPTPRPASTPQQLVDPPPPRPRLLPCAVLLAPSLRLAGHLRLQLLQVRVRGFAPVDAPLRRVGPLLCHRELAPELEVCVDVTLDRCGAEGGGRGGRGGGGGYQAGPQGWRSRGSGGGG